jgi:hypothetical protein
MTLKQLAKHLDQRAMAFARSGRIDKSLASMTVAAFIRGQPKEFQKTKIPLDFFDVDK